MLIDLMGKELEVGQFAGGIPKVIRTESLDEGIYVIQFRLANGHQFSEKFIKSE
jgi:hypothetical protein